MSKVLVKILGGHLAWRISRKVSDEKVVARRSRLAPVAHEEEGDGAKPGMSTDYRTNTRNQDRAVKMMKFLLDQIRHTAGIQPRSIGWILGINRVQHRPPPVLVISISTIKWTVCIKICE